MPEKISCFHCGDDCGKYPVIYDYKHFCCHGCKTVYEILRENKLFKYYELSDNPGLKVNRSETTGKYDFLENNEIAEKLIDFRDDSYTRVIFYIPSIHCSSCIWLLENLGRVNSAIIMSQVNFSTKELTVLFRNDKFSLRQLAELLDLLNYPPHISLDSLGKNKNAPFDRQLLIKIGIAGFLFGNIMLFSMPYYIPGKELIEEPFKNFFTWLNLVLSIPVLFYCGADYLKSGLKNLYHWFIDINLPIAIGMLAIFFQSAFETVTQSGHGYYDSLSGLIFFLLVGRWYQDKTYRALSFERDYKSYFPAAVLKISGDREFYEPLDKLTFGDIILIRNQELIPADGILLSGQALIDYSFVTGESRPVIIAEKQQVFAGGKIIGNAARIMINKEVQQSRLTELWNKENYKFSRKPTFTRLIDRVSRTFTLTVIFIAVITFVYWLMTYSPNALRAAVAVLIVACPCALALSIPFAFGNTMRLFGKYGFYLKKSEVVEKIHQCTTIIFDKTGTLTETDSASAGYSGIKLSEEEKTWVHAAVRNSIHPLSKAVAEYLKENYNPALTVENFREVISSGIIAEVEGHKIMAGSADFVTGESVAQGSSEVWLSVDHVVKGKFTISVRYREGLDKIISRLKGKYDIHIISGDHDAERKTLEKIFPPDTTIRFNLSPAEKLEYVRNLNASGKKVLMIGDGLNDAGALRESHAGISIADKIFHFSPACDAVLEAGQFARLFDFIDLSDKAIRIVKLSLLISFFYNLTGLFFAVRAMLSPLIAAVLMPASSVSVVAFVVLLTNFAVQRSMKKHA